jgi:hypothetical protein
MSTYATVAARSHMRDVRSVPQAWHVTDFGRFDGAVGLG